MATVSKTRIFHSIILLFVALICIENTDADDLYRCPSHIPRNRYLRTHRQRCYEFVYTEKHWFGARDWCQRRGGALITIEERHIQAFVEVSLNALRWDRNGLWIGATDDHKEHDWRWVNNVPVDRGYDNWDSGQPSCFLPKFLCKEDCACLRLDEGFKWHDYFCRAGGFEYSFICQYEMGPPTTTQRPTTTTTTTTTTEKPTTSPSPSPVIEPEIIPSIHVEQAATVGLSHSDLTQTNTSTSKSPTSSATLEPLIHVESQRIMSEKEGLQTGSVVGMVVSFVLIFIAGIVVGVFLCRRRYRKRYEDAVSPGFNNVLYTAAPQRTKETNLMVGGGGACAVMATDDEDEVDHKYCDIDEIVTCSNQVKLPNKDSGLPEDPPPKYCSDGQEEEPVASGGGACGVSNPTPCHGDVAFKQFTPDFLSKNTDVSEAYSNNLYGYHS